MVLFWHFFLMKKYSIPVCNGFFFENLSYFIPHPPASVIKTRINQLNVSNKVFWWLQTQFWERGGLSEGDVLFTFWLFCSHHLSCSQASQEFRAVLGLAESNLINSSSWQSSSIRQELLVSTTLRHSLSPHAWAPVGGSPLGISVLTLAAFAMMLFLGSLIWNQELLRMKSGAPPKRLSHPLPANNCVRGDIKPKVRWEEPDPLTYLRWSFEPLKVHSPPGLFHPTGAISNGEKIQPFDNLNATDLGLCGFSWKIYCCWKTFQA